MFVPVASLIVALYIVLRVVFEDPISELGIIKFVGREYDPYCSIENLNELRKSAIVYTWVCAGLLLSAVSW